jgi:hypothetical protein
VYRRTNRDCGPVWHAHPVSYETDIADVYRRTNRDCGPVWHAHPVSYETDIADAATCRVLCDLISTRGLATASLHTQ